MSTIPELKKQISSFNFNECPRGNQGFSRVLIQLFGFAGNGKSSFVNTCKYVLEDQPFKIYADITTKYGGNTMARISYPLTNTLTLVDNRGCAMMNSYETGEIFAQLGNLLPLDEKVEWGKGYDGIVGRIVRAESLVQASDFIYPVYVHSLKRSIPREEIEELKKLLTTAKELTGIFPHVILTYKTSGNLDAVKTTFKQMGVEYIFALENFTPENNVKTEERVKDVLMFFWDVIEDITCRVEKLRDPQAEREKRKEFVLKFVHDREMQNRSEIMEKRRADEKNLQGRQLVQRDLELAMYKERQQKLEFENQELARKLEMKKNKTKKNCETQ